MEYTDVFSLFVAGLAIGFIAGHWTRKQDLKLEYERGRLAGISFLWPHLARAWIEQILASPRKSAGDPPTGGAGGA